MSEKSKRIEYLDGWRAAAICSVLVSHFSRGWGGWLGDFGVELFFALSGLLMAQILFVRGAALGPFMIRRMTRVYPAMAVFVLAMGTASFLGTKAHLIPPAMQLSLMQFVAALGFSTNYYFAATGQHSVLGHTWSLGVELFCYALLAFIALIFGRDARRIIPILLAISVVSMIFGAWLMQQANFGWESVYWRTDARMGSIILPAAALLFIRERKLPKWTMPVTVAAAAIIFYHSGPIMKHTIGTVLVALSICSLESTYSVIKHALSNRVLTGIGMISYSLYLWQQPFWKAAAKGPAWMSAAALVPALVAASVSYFLVEKPVREWLDRRLLPGSARKSQVVESNLSNKMTT